VAIDFKHHDALRLFVAVAHYNSFSAAADALHVTKGAISSQIKKLESQLDIKLFERNARGISLTSDGIHLLGISQSHYRNIETAIADIKLHAKQPLTVAMSTYFAARWLSPKLMTFMQLHPEIQLRIQPMTQLFELENQGVDVAIRWGSGSWNDVDVEPFLITPTWPVANPHTAKRIAELGLKNALQELTLLHDQDNSKAWSDWFGMLGLPSPIRNETLIIPDPNVRVQAVIDGQGVALMDFLVSREIEENKLERFSDESLASYGYFLAIPRSGMDNESVNVFVSWLKGL